jgi:hypothetical protein
MISRRSLFGLALLPLADDKSAPKIYDDSDFVSVTPAVDFGDYYTFRTEVQAAATMASIKARAVERLRL